MSDETIQYITTDYLIEVDGGDPTPAPIEYIVELGQVGVQGIPGEKGEPGFTPTVSYILNNDTFKINIVNQDGVTQTPNLYDYFADKNGYLKVDGSNANNPITLNGCTIRQYDNTTFLLNNKIRYQTTGQQLHIGDQYGDYLTFGSNSIIYNKANNHYASPDTLATISDIPTVGNGIITITQGGVTKGTFTTNQSGDTTIDLDEGGGSITNPLVINSDNGLKNLSIGYNSDNELSILSTWLYNGTVPIPLPAYLIGGTNNPISLSNTSTNHGLKTINLNYNTDTLELDANNYLNVKDVFLSKDGSNATNNFKIHNTELTQNSVDISNVKAGGFSVVHSTNNDIHAQLSISNSRGLLSLPSISIASYPYSGTLHSNYNEIAAYGDIIITNGASYKLYYGTKNANNEVAKVGDIPTTMTGADGTNAGTAGLVPAPAATDNTKFLRGDGTWQTVGGGSSYTAGTGIDITNDTISIDTSVVAQLSDIPTVPTNISSFVNDSGYITNSALSGYATETWVGNQGYLTSSDISDMATKTWVGQQGYITGITSSDVTTALGYTPYNSSNPNGYTSNVGTVTSVNNVQPDSNGNVSITPTITVIDGGNA